MVNRLHTAFHEERRNVRVPENRRVWWSAQNNDAVNEGRIRNISAAGMLLEIDASVPPADRGVLSFEVDKEHADFVPSAGEVVWCRNKWLASKKHLCGIRFTDIPEAILPQLRHRIQEGIKHQAGLRRFHSLVSMVCVGVIAVLTGYVLHLGFAIYQELSDSNQQLLKVSSQQAFLTRNYQELYNQTTQRLAQVTDELGVVTKLYEESQRMLRAAYSELDALKATLAQSQAMLALAQKENMQLRREMESVGLLKNRDAQLTDEVNALRSELDRWEGDFHSAEDGKAFLGFYHDRIRQVKVKIREIKRQVKAAKIAALRERDRIRMILGNNGFLMREGRIVEVNLEKYENGSQALEPAATSFPAQNVRVNVNVFP